MGGELEPRAVFCSGGISVSWHRVQSLQGAVCLEIRPAHGVHRSEGHFIKVVFRFNKERAGAENLVFYDTTIILAALY